MKPLEFVELVANKDIPKRITINAEEIVATGEGKIGGKWPKTLMRNGYEYSLDDNVPPQAQYILDLPKMANDILAELKVT